MSLTLPTLRQFHLLAVVLYIVVLNDLAGPARCEDSANTSSNDPLVQLQFLDDQKHETTVEGRVLQRVKNGWVLLEDRSARLWTVTVDNLLKETPLAKSQFAPLSNEEMGQYLTRELSESGNKDDFLVHSTEHYVICTNTSLAYAQWCGGLLERLHKAFRVFWTARGFDLHEPEFPLPVVILKSRAEYATLAEYDKTPASAKGDGYFLVTANRIVLFDLTATERQAPAKSVAEVARRVRSLPQSVGTVVHEATHQIAFNTGLHTRFADNPIWMTEGMAMYFETPDSKNRRGWQTIGRMNRARKAQFLDYVANRREPQSLKQLISSNDRFQSREGLADTYAEAWALSYFLIRTKPRQYSAWLKQISQKNPLKFDSPEERLNLFRTAFGKDLSQLDRNLLSWIRRQK